MKYITCCILQCFLLLSFIAKYLLLLLYMQRAKIPSIYLKKTMIVQELKIIVWKQINIFLEFY